MLRSVGDVSLHSSQRGALSAGATWSARGSRRAGLRSRVTVHRPLCLACAWVVGCVDSGTRRVVDVDAGGAEVMVAWHG
jgi:hypothetical protein